MLGPDNWLTETMTEVDAFGTEPIVRPLRTPGVKHVLPGPSELADDREQEHDQTFAKWLLHDPLSREELAQGAVQRFGDFSTKRCSLMQLLSELKFVLSQGSAPPRPATEATVIVYSNTKAFHSSVRCPRPFSAPADASRTAQVFGEHTKIPFTDVFTCLLDDYDEKNKTFEEVEEEVQLNNFWCDRDGVERFGDFSTICCALKQLISDCQVMEHVIERHRDASPDCSFVQSQQSAPPLPAMQVTVSVISDLIDFLSHQRSTRTSSAADGVSRPMQLDEERANISFTEVFTSLICDYDMETKRFEKVQEETDVLVVWCYWEADIPREILLELQPKKTTLLAFQRTDPLLELSKNVTYREERRFHTFRNWSHQALVPDVQLAQGPSAHGMAPLLHGSVAAQRSGGSLDHWRVKPSLRVEVPCAFCGMEVCAWKPGDEPLREHACHCSYVPLLQNPTLPGEHNSGHDVQVEALGVQLSKLGVKTVVGPKHPSRTSPHARMRSFDNWPSTSPKRPNELVNAGFFYIGLHDYTKCFHCDGGLCNWDASDDPWEEHARWFPRCQFVLLSKGEAYIDQCLRRHGLHLNWVAALTSTGGFNEDEGTTTELEALMRSDDVQFCLSQGVPVETLRVALLQHMRDQGRGLASRDELLQVLRDLPGLPRSSNGKTAVEQSSPGRNAITPPSPPSLPEKPPGRKMTAAAKGSASSPLPSELSALAQENLRLKEQGLCKVCLDAEVAVVFLPCGHLVACPACASALTKCPVCRTAIGAAVRTLLS